MDDLRPHKQALLENESQTAMRSAVRSAVDTSLKGPLRESLIEDAATNLLSFFELEDASFPAPSPQAGEPVSDLVDSLVGGVPSIEEENEIKWGLRKKPKEYSRPISFPKFRHAPILRSDDGEKLWIAPKIPNGGKEAYIAGTSIREMTGLPSKGYTERYVPFRIECGRWHLHNFLREGTAKTCKVEVDDGDVFFHYAFSFDEKDRGDPQAIVGVDRGRAITGAWAAVDRGGQVLKSGASMKSNVRDRLKDIDQEIADAQNRGADVSALYQRRRAFVRHTLHHIANRIVSVADDHNALIAFEDLENITGATRNANLDRGLRRSQYSRLLEYTEQKAEEHGLRVKQVAPHYTSQTCPCGHGDPDSREGRTFECVKCGYEAHADLNAARMIGLRGLEYLRGGGYDSFASFVSELSLRNGH